MSDEVVEAEDAEKLPKEESKKKKRGRPKKMALPLYFEEPALTDEATLEIQRMEAQHWLLGTGPFQESGKSYSAHVTYSGPRRFLSQTITLGKRSIAPNRGNWRCFNAPVRFWQNQECQSIIKDAKFLLDALTTPGGKKNYSVRFVEDEPLGKKEEKKQLFRRDLSRFLAMNPRIRLDQIKMGLKIPLNPGEASQFLEELSKEGLPKGAKGVAKYLNELIAEEARVKKEESKQSKN